MAALSDDELVNLLLETCYDLGVYSMLTNETQLYDVKPAKEARDKMRADLLNRLKWLRDRADAVEAGREAPIMPESQFEPRKITNDPTARDVLLALIPAIWRATERKKQRSRAAAFALIQRFNSVLRPMGWEYLMRPGFIIVLRKPRKRWTWADETR